MKTIKNYESLLEKTFATATKNFTSKDSVEQAESAKLALISELKNDSYIKIPFVGDFSAGKSSLINSYIGVELLPTDVAPQTAVSYELFYSEDEHLEVYHDSVLKTTTALEDIAGLNVVPGDIVKVFIKNEPVKKLNDANIVIVDMPGIDSGIEAHNKAIMNYISEGTYFIIIMECTVGSFRNSTISFINEIKKYGLSFSVLLSKSDKLPEKELQKNRLYIEEQAKSILCKDISVGVTSAVSNNHTDLDRILDNINADDYISAKYKSRVIEYVNNVISELKLQLSLLMTKNDSLSQRIEQVKVQKENALKDLQEQNSQAQDVSLSAEDILNDIREALIEKADYLATIVFNNKDNQKLFTDEVMHIIRPVLIESFKREISEYQDSISASVKDFAINVDAILNDSDNMLLNGANQVYEKLINKETLESLAKTGINKLSALLVNYKSFSTLLLSLGKILGPIMAIAINFIPDIFRLLFGKSDTKKKQEIADKLKTETIPQILDAMRDDIERMLSEQREIAMGKMQEIINEESRKYDDNIKEMMDREQENEQERSKQMEKLTEDINILLAGMAEI